MGDSFAAGTIDGPGAFSFRQSELAFIFNNYTIIYMYVHCTVNVLTCDVYMYLCFIAFLYFCFFT